MATQPIPGATPVCKAASSAYWDGALVAEDISLDLERVSEMAWALATADAFNEQSQHSFASIAILIRTVSEKAKREEDRLTALSGKGGN